MELLLQNTLSLKGSHEGLMWMYTEKPDTWCKFTQYVPQINVKKYEFIEKNIEIIPDKKIENIPETIKKDDGKKEQKHEKKEKKIDEKKLEEVPKQTILMTCIKDEDNKKNNVKSSKKILPIELIVQMSENNMMNVDYIKQELQTFISQKEFSKIFGIKKCSEIMSGITNNKWNKSLVLFISFLFDKKFIYLNKDVIYDVEKCNGDLIYI
jgi:hypothetical protein